MHPRDYGLLVVRLTRTDQSYTTTICLGYDSLLPGRPGGQVTLQAPPLHGGQATTSVTDLCGAMWPFIREGHIEAAADTVDGDDRTATAPLVEEIHRAVSHAQVADAHVP
jgi:hypothetical protein